MMTVADVCKLSEEVLTGELLISVFLDRAYLDPNSKEADREFVLRATYPTLPLRAMLEHIAQKLSGKHPKGSVIVRGSYGSGKSHTLLAIYHVVRPDSLGRDTLIEWGVKAVLPDRVRVVAVQLRAELPGTLWERLFERAGRGELNEQVGDYPTREQWAILGREMPTLVIVDELEQWFEAQDRKEQARTKSALANLLEAAELNDTPLAVVLAVYGTNSELMAVINRTKPPIWDVGTAEDRQRIVQHRLIDRLDEVKARKAVGRYIETYEKVRGELPSLVNLADLRREMEKTYPFHPHFLHQAYQVYAAMPHHESTRGVVGICATLLGRRAKERDLILTGDLDITDEEIASDLRKLNPDLVQNATEDLRQRCTDIPEAPGIIGTVLLHSFSPHGDQGATEEDVLIGNLRPDININELKAALYDVKTRAWFLDEINERLMVTRDVVLVKQIEQIAHMQLGDSEGRERAAEYLRGFIRRALNVEHLIFYPDQPLPRTGGTGLKYIISLAPISRDEAEEILRKLDNTAILLVPKPQVRKKITANDDLLLRALRILVCEDLLKQKGKRQNEIRNLKRRYEGELEQWMHDSYALWMRLSRTNELGEEPSFVVRPEECELSLEYIDGKLKEIYDVDAMRHGIAKLLQFQGRDKPKGSEHAGLTIGQIRQSLQRERGLPILSNATRENFESGLRQMVEDRSDSGIVVQAGKMLFGYDEVNLPSVLTDSWRVWLKPYAPEPPAPEDVKQHVRGELAKAGENGISVKVLITDEEVGRALIELINEGEAILEQGEERYPEDGTLSEQMIADDGTVWLAENAPPDDRKARKRILDLVKGAGKEGIRWEQVQAVLRAEDIPSTAIDRAVDRMMRDERGPVGFYDADGQTVIHDPRAALSGETVLRWRSAAPPPPLWLHFSVSIPSYRLPTSTDLLLGELRTKLKEESHIDKVSFTARSVEGETDPLFGTSEGIKQLAQIQAEHSLTWEFERSINKEAFLNSVENLVKELAEKGDITLEIIVEGKVPHDGN